MGKKMYGRPAKLVSHRPTNPSIPSPSKQLGQVPNMTGYAERARVVVGGRAMRVLGLAGRPYKMYGEKKKLSVRLGNLRKF